MLIANLAELMTKGTSGLFNALVALATALSIAELRAEKELMRTNVRLIFSHSCRHEAIGEVLGCRGEHNAHYQA